MFTVEGHQRFRIFDSAEALDGESASLTLTRFSGLSLQKTRQPLHPSQRRSQLYASSSRSLLPCACGDIVNIDLRKLFFRAGIAIRP